jgi:hypothetical protein
MRIVKSANNKKKLIMSRAEWETMGRKAGWGDVLKGLVSPIVDPLKKAFEPDATNPYIEVDELDSGKFNLDKHYNEQKIMETKGNEINMADVKKRYDAMNCIDPTLILAFPKALDFINNPSPTTKQNIINGIKVVLFRIVNLPKGNNNRAASEQILAKWYKEKTESDRIWEKPKNPYL